jgi:Flp pilus assembly protein TadG
MMRSVQKFRKANGGLAAVEFALIIPVMLFTFFGIAEIANYVLAARKVATSASSAADLVAQAKTIDSSQLNDIMGAVGVIIRPFDVASSTVRITSVVADADGNRTVDWSEARRTSPYVPGSPAPSFIPSAVVPPNTSVIVAEVSFTYQTFFGMYLNKGGTVSDVFYLRPRRSVQVDRVP